MKWIEWMTNFKVESYLKRDFPLHTFDQYFKLKKKKSKLYRSILESVFEVQFHKF